MTLLRTIVPAPVRVATWRHWVYLVLGGAVFLPYVFVAMYPLSLGRELATGAYLTVVAVVLLALVGSVAATGSAGAVRSVEVATARELLGGRIRSVTMPERPTRDDRWRSGVYFTAHLVAGGVIGTLTITMVPLALTWIAYPLTDWVEGTGMGPAQPSYAMPAYGVAMLLGFAYLCAGLGAMLMRIAPRLLGPSPAAQLEQMERVADDLAERNRLARDLHDSVGHSLSVVTLQAGAARRMWSKDPDFAYEALGAVEQSARTALADLDHVLGLLREESAEEASATMLQLDTLVRRTRATGVIVDVDLDGDPATLPISVSREAYLMVQEGLTNATRHAPDEPIELCVDVGQHSLRLSIRNPMPSAAATSRPSGGRGVRGMRERVEAMGGSITIGAETGVWLVDIGLDWEALV